MSVFAPKKKTIKDPERYQTKTVKKSKKPRVSICTEQEHCKLLKSCFFNTIVDAVLNDDIDTDLEELFKRKLEECFTGSISEAAVWVISYLKDKKIYLTENKTKKVNLGPYGLGFIHILNIEKIIKILEKILKNIKEENENICSEFCTISYHDSIKLIF